MGKRVAITDSYLNSVFKLGAQDRKATLNTVKQLSENPNSPSLHVHSIDRAKCDKRFLSARVNLDFFDLSKNANKEYISIMSGAEPEIIGTRNDADENRVIVERIKALIPEYDLNQICILAPTYGKLSAIKTILEYENINTYLLIEEKGDSFCS